MTTPKVTIKQASHSAIVDLKPAALLVNDSLPLQGVAQNQTTYAGGPEIGVWESTPGHFARNVAAQEFCHIIAGECTFTPTDGEAIHLSAGDAVFFPAATQGIWHVTKTLRKTYVIFNA